MSPKALTRTLTLTLQVRFHVYNMRPANFILPGDWGQFDPDFPYYLNGSSPLSQRSAIAKILTLSITLTLTLTLESLRLLVASAE